MDNIWVTKPYLPPLDEFIPYLSDIWSSRVLTNRGKFHQVFEDELARFLGVDHITLFNNGTLALIAAQRVLGLSGEVITTPFSFVATSSSLVLNNITPVFVDIEEDTFNIDEKLIESSITEKTTGILPVHCYGFSCNVSKIQTIAHAHNLKVIYDGCHAFGVSDESGSILNYGDMAAVSFHATKVLNTFEGGAVVSRDRESKILLENFSNFGITDETHVSAVGLNAKMNEFSAALGLVQLKHYNHIASERRRVHNRYCEQIKLIPGIKLPSIPPTIIHNYSYYPLLVTDDFVMSRDDLYLALKKFGVNSRRYFYPLISQFDCYNSPSLDIERFPVANKISRQILCLPIYPDLTNEQVDYIIDKVRSLSGGIS